MCYRLFPRMPATKTPCFSNYGQAPALYQTPSPLRERAGVRVKIQASIRRFAPLPGGEGEWLFVTASDPHASRKNQKYKQEPCTSIERMATRVQFLSTTPPWPRADRAQTRTTTRSRPTESSPG